MEFKICGGHDLLFSVCFSVLFVFISFRFVSRSLSLFRFVHVNVCISWCAASVGCFVVSFYLFNRHCFTHTHRASMWIGMHFFAAQQHLCTQSVCVVCELLLLSSCCCCCFFRFIPFLLLTSFFLLLWIFSLGYHDVACVVNWEKRYTFTCI